MSPSAPPAPPAPTVVAPRPAWRLRASGLIDVGTTPGPVTGGAALSAEARLGGWHLGVEGRWLAASATPIGAGEVAADAWAVAGLGCRDLGPLDACGTAAAGWQQGRGAGFAINREAGAPLLALGLRLRTEVAVAPGWALGLFGEVATPLAETRLRVDGEAAWVTPAVVGLGGVGLAISP